jgi:hypothetical protein
MDVTAIDLHSRRPSILELDFLLMDPASQPEHREAWDVVSLSLVLNFVPDGKDRGTRETVNSRKTFFGRFRWCFLFFFLLFFRADAHAMLRSGGLCFLAVRLTSSSALNDLSSLERRAV